VSNNTQLNIPIGDADPLSLPLLHTFACHSTFITADHLKLITQASIKAGNLKRLSVGGRDTDFHNTPVTNEFPASKTVEELSLAAMILGDERMAQIVNLYPNLKRLDASATKITGVSVKKFVNLGIKWLRLSECQDVGTDAVEWARGMGVEVEYLFPSRSLPGRVQRFAETTFARGF
jgi:F-box/TPR repeat protein Pof3